MGGLWSKAEPPQVPNRGKTTAPIIGFPEATCDEYMFNTTGCNITIQGKLLLVLDSINSTLRNYFSCFCEVVQARLNNTNVTTEILAGGNQSTCRRPDSHSNVDEVLLQEKLQDLNLEYEPLDQYAGMAVILTDRSFTADNFSALLENQEPFVYVVNVGENESQNGSCRRQYRPVKDMMRISDIGLELESIACNPRSFYMNNTCAHEIPSSTIPSLAVIQVASLPLLISSVVAALVLVVFIILFFATKFKRREMRSSKNTTMENSAINSGFGTQEGSGIGLLTANDIYNELWENEKRTTDDGSQENYHHLDSKFVKDEVDPSQYDHVTEKNCDHYEFVLSPG